MQIVYAPVGGFYFEQDYTLSNIVQGFDIQILETLCDAIDTLGAGGGGAKSIFLIQTPPNINQKCSR
ncbi:MAG: hypothetical protein K2N12_00535 [Helicobacter sp.]|nr:hypothetical protein [Helicobacter sp.]